jgi:glucuronosyltransferase
LFITQCGLQSVQEAVYHGVPILAVPIFGDQKYNAKKIATEEIGLQLPFRDITKEELLTSITAILNNPKYVQVKYVDIMTVVLKNTLNVKHRYKLNKTD